MYIRNNNILLGLTGECDFNAGTCDWTNKGGDFEWSIARTTSKSLTGPLTDQAASAGNPTGGKLHSMLTACLALFLFLNLSIPPSIFPSFCASLCPLSFLDYLYNCFFFCFLQFKELLDFIFSIKTYSAYLSPLYKIYILCFVQ